MVEAMNEDAVEEEYYQASTLISVADVRKHTTGVKVELPTDLLGLIWMFNNYCRLLDVLFGPNCLYLVHVRAIKDGLEMHENYLEPKITKTLCLHLLWQIHYDSRQFFLSCERWAPGEPLPRSSLAGAVNQFFEDCAIEMTLTCPVSSFMGPPPKAPIFAMAGAWPTASGTQPGRAKPSINTAILPNCKKMVKAFNALYPTMSFLTLIKWGGLKFSDLKVGGRGGCSNFGLLGRCAGRTYNHVACTVSPDRQAAINDALKLARAILKKGTFSA
jgi:hypothetical protein